MSAEIVRINKEQPEASLVTYVAEQLKAGQVLGMPTDTFYGLAADPVNLRAVDRIYDIKTRSRHKPLSLLIESIDQADYEIEGGFERQMPHWAEQLFLGKSDEDRAAIRVKDRESGAVAFSYVVVKEGPWKKGQSAAEACAKHIKEVVARE